MPYVELRNINILDCLYVTSETEAAKMFHCNVCKRIRIRGKTVICIINGKQSVHVSVKSTNPVRIIYAKLNWTPQKSLLLVAIPVLVYSM